MYKSLFFISAFLCTTIACPLTTKQIGGTVAATTLIAGGLANGIHRFATKSKREKLRALSKQLTLTRLVKDHETRREALHLLASLASIGIGIGIGIKTARTKTDAPQKPEHPISNPAQETQLLWNCYGGMLGGKENAATLEEKIHAIAELSPTNRTPEQNTLLPRLKLQHKLYLAIRKPDRAAAQKNAEMLTKSMAAPTS